MPFTRPALLTRTSISLNSSGRFDMKLGHLVGLADVELDGEDFNAVTNVFVDVLRDLLEDINPPCREDELEVLGRGASEFFGDGAANAGAGAGHEDGLAFEALRHGGGHVAQEDRGGLAE